LGYITKDEEEFCQAKFQKAFSKKLMTGATDHEMRTWMRMGDCRV
jgi:hypothetical protein